MSHDERQASQSSGGTSAGALAKRVLRSEWQSLSENERAVIDGVLRRLGSEPYAAEDIDAQLSESRSFGQHLADRIASFGGSWTFILLFLGFLGLWILFNSAFPGRGQAFDPYPFIFLNLMLSMVAALQAPVIMMSQNRAAERDRRAAKNDYQVNIRAEVEIRELHEKLDVLREAQWAELVQMQNEQLRILQNLLRDGGTLPGPTAS